MIGESAKQPCRVWFYPQSLVQCQVRRRALKALEPWSSAMTGKALFLLTGTLAILAALGGAVWGVLGYAAARSSTQGIDAIGKPIDGPKLDQWRRDNAYLHTGTPQP